MAYTIYFGDKALIITPEAGNLPNGNKIKTVQAGDPLVVQQMVKQLENGNLDAAYLVHPQPEFAFEALKKDFQFIQAAGGLVTSPNGNLLLIFRKGKWDLPKGKLDEGEDLEQCAVREVAEETGLQGIVLKELLCRTYHTYYQNGVPCLKESVWYRMEAPEQEQLHPQTEEDIETAIWAKPADVAKYLENTHRSVADVLKGALKSL